MFIVAVHPSEPSTNWAEMFSRARSAADLKHDTLARMMKISASQLSQQLAERGHLSLFKLVRVAADPDPAGKRFVVELFDLIAEEFGFGERDPLAHALGQLLAVVGSVVGRTQLRMARAELPIQDAQQRRRA